MSADESRRVIGWRLYGILGIHVLARVLGQDWQFFASMGAFLAGLGAMLSGIAAIIAARNKGKKEAKEE